MAAPKTVVRASYGLIFIEQTGITTPFTTPQFPFLQTVQQATLDSIHPAFVLSSGPSIAPIPLTADAGLGQGVFTVTPQFRLGNASRDPARGPAYRDLDLGLVKDTRFGDRLTLQLRGEVFNVTNTPAFAQPNAIVGVANFGSITATTADPRVVQVAGKLLF